MTYFLFHMKQPPRPALSFFPAFFAKNIKKAGNFQHLDFLL